MKKLLIYSLMIIILIPLINAICCERNKNCVIAETCQDAACGNCSIIVYNRSGSTKIARTDMNIVNAYLYTFNASTSLSDYGTYPYAINCSNNKICQGVCQVEVMQECEGENEEYLLYIVAFVVFVVLVGIGYYYEEGWFIIIAGMLAIITGVVIYTQGFPNLNNDFLKNSIAIIIWGVGAIVMFFPIMQFYEDWK